MCNISIAKHHVKHRGLINPLHPTSDYENPIVATEYECLYSQTAGILSHLIDTKLIESFRRREIAQQLTGPVAFRGLHDLKTLGEHQLPLL
jgi:hypothetical protein